MKNKMLRVVLLIAVVSLVVLPACAQPGTPRQNTSFNFIFKYGVGAGNILDTFENSYTRDMVIDPPERTKMVLTDHEMNSIYAKMRDIGFFDYPVQFSIPMPKEGSVGMVTPHQTYYFKVTVGTQSKELTWEDNIITVKSEPADKLRELITLILKIIEAKPEYKTLPTPRGGYI